MPETNVERVADDEARAKGVLKVRTIYALTIFSLVDRYRNIRATPK